MRAHEIIRGVLDLIDQIESDQEFTQDQPTSAEFYDDEARRMNQIKDLIPDEAGTYDNSPVIATASITSVTTDAGGGWMAPKHPADIRADSIAMYPGANHVR